MAEKGGLNKKVVGISQVKSGWGGWLQKSKRREPGNWVKIEMLETGFIALRLAKIVEK